MKKQVIVGVVALLLIGLVIGGLWYWKTKKVGNSSPYEGKFILSPDGVGIYEVLNGKAVHVPSPEIMAQKMMERYGSVEWIYEKVTPEEFSKLQA